MNFKCLFFCVLLGANFLSCRKQLTKTESSSTQDSREWIFEEVLCSFKNQEFYNGAKKYWLVNEVFSTPRESYFLDASFFKNGQADSLQLINSKEPYGSRIIDIRERCGISGIDRANRKLFTDEFYAKNEHIVLFYPVELKENQYVLSLIVTLGLPDVANEYQVLVEKKDGKVDVIWDRMYGD